MASKKNKQYWTRRMKLMEDAIKDGAYKNARTLEKQYRKSISEIDTKIRAWYQRLADNNGVSYAEAQKLLNKDELEEFHWTVREYIDRGSGVISGDWVKQLENASARVHITRLEALKLQLQQHAEELAGKTIYTTKKSAEAAYTESYYHTAYEVQQLAGVGVTMQKVDTVRLEKVLSRPWTTDGLTFTNRCWTNKDKLVGLLNKELTVMAATGAKPDRAIRNIAKAFDTSAANASRVVMTESAFFASAAQKDCFTDLNVERFEVVGTFDSRMCDFCGKKNGKVFPMKDFRAGENAPPFHPWCRCTTAPYDEDLAGIGERWARDIETGKGYYVPSDMTYDEWKATQDAKYGEGAVDKARKKAYNEKADREQYERWKPTLKDEGIKSFDAFQEKKYTSPEEYKQLVDYARYRKRVPEATKEDYKSYRAIKETGIYGSPRVPALRIDATEFSFDNEHISKRKHLATEEEAKSYIENAYFSLTRRFYDGTIFTNFYNADGAAYVSREEKTIRTAFKREEFDPTTLEAVKAYEESRN